jgi:rod shape-determining protein MreC
MDTLFSRESQGIGRLLALGALSLALLVAGAGTTWLVPVRTALAAVVAPIDYAAGLPNAWGASATLALSSRASLVSRVASLERENTRLAAAASRYQAALKDNDRLRALLESSERGGRDRAVAAQLVAESVAPREVVIDKGLRHDVRVGAAVVDAHGLFGQVVEAKPFTARVLLVTDPAHAVPVHTLRNDVRAIAAGAGAGALTLTHAPITVDIREGDTLVTSGLGGRFPSGYPVGTVVSVGRDATQMFATVAIRPLAALDRSRHLLVLRGGASPAPCLDGAEQDACGGEPDAVAGPAPDRGAVAAALAEPTD